MKKKINLICAVCATLLLYDVRAQIGIQTEYPLGVLHIDPKRDTNVTGSNGTSDEIIVTSSGNVGIGTLDPTAKLDIRGTFRLRDGNQGLGKVLVTDALGNAQWSDRPKIEVIEVNGIDTILWTKYFGITPTYSGISISLPRGSWQIIFQVVMNGASNLIWDLTDSDSSYIPPLADLANRRAVSSAYTPLAVNAIYFVNQEQDEITTYYLWATSLVPTLASYRAGGTMWALPMD